MLYLLLYPHKRVLVYSLVGVVFICYVSLCMYNIGYVCKIFNSAWWQKDIKIIKKMDMCGNSIELVLINISLRML